MLDDNHLAAILARTDAVASLLLSVLIEKGVVSVPEMNALLDSMCDFVGATAEGAMVATVFLSMKALLNKKAAIGPFSCGEAGLLQ